jgi:polysaccharide pyruvyl transferase WcaK-like protein
MIRVLIVGYYAMSNFGSEARLHVIIDDLKSLGREMKITVVSVLDFKEESFPGVEFVRLGKTSMFNPIRLIKHIRKADIIINGEGIAFTDFCGVGFLAYFLPILYLANKFGKKTVCYSFDIDHLTKLDSLLTKQVLSKTDLLIVRTPDSAEQLKKMGFEKKVFVAADPALLYTKKKILPQFKRTKRPRFGIVVKDFFCYPILPKLFGKREDLYSYPYYYSYGNGGKEKLAEFKRSFVEYVRFLQTTYSAEIYIVVLDHLMDFAVSQSIYNEVSDDANVRLVTFRNHSIDEIAGLISSFDFIVSSRLHGLIFALQHRVPMVGLESDERFKYFFDYIDMPEYCLDYRKRRDVKSLQKLTEKALGNKVAIERRLGQKYETLSAKARLNKQVFKEFLDLYY